MALLHRPSTWCSCIPVSQAPLSHHSLGGLLQNDLMLCVDLRPLVLNGHLAVHTSQAHRLVKSSFFTQTAIGQSRTALDSSATSVSFSACVVSRRIHLCLAFQVCGKQAHQTWSLHAHAMNTNCNEPTHKELSNPRESDGLL